MEANKHLDCGHQSLEDDFVLAGKELRQGDVLREELDVFVEKKYGHVKDSRVHEAVKR